MLSSCRDVQVDCEWCLKYTKSPIKIKIDMIDMTYEKDLKGGVFCILHSVASSFHPCSTLDVTGGQKSVSATGAWSTVSGGGWCFKAVQRSFRGTEPAHSPQTTTMVPWPYINKRLPVFFTADSHKTLSVSALRISAAFRWATKTKPSGPAG